MDTRDATFICRVSGRELTEFKDLCALLYVSHGDPMYQLRMSREFGPTSWRAQRDAHIQGEA